jgi:hypothetical protein
MSEKYCTRVASVASGTAKTLINIFHSAATPVCRGRIVNILVGSVATPGDQAADFLVNRTTAVGTEGSGLVPNNLDPGGPAGEMDSGLGVYGGEPTVTAAKQLLAFQLNQRATINWIANPGFELYMTATQNNGANLQTVTSTSTQAYGATIFFEE